MDKWRVSETESGSKLLPFIKSKKGDIVSLRSIKRQIDSHQCFVNGRSIHIATFTLHSGDTVELAAEELPKKRIVFEKQRILFEDEFMLIYNKPPGITCDEKGILPMLTGYNKQVQLIHRLDKETSGVLLLAKSKDIYQAFVDLFRNKSVQKTYLALVHGSMTAKEGFISNLLGKKVNLQGQTIWGEVKSGGLLAETKWRVHSKMANASCLFCFPYTGRTHQLRVHLAGIKHPIMGDHQYNQAKIGSYKAPRLLLHAYAISFTHPVSKKVLQIEAPLPDDFQKAYQDLFKKVFHE